MKSILVLLLTSLSFFAFSQNTAMSLSKPTPSAEKTTLNLIKLYSLSNEQATEVKKIQEDKFKALAKIEELKNKDIQKYIAKKLSAYETADNAIMALLDEQQLAIFKKAQVEKSIQYENIMAGSKNKGVSQSDINKKLAELEF